MNRFCFSDIEGKEIKCYKWTANGNPKGIIQIVHGMTEYALRYEYFAKKLCENGYTVYAHDHRGHGETSKEEEERGYIADNEGFDLLVEDVKELTDIIKKENPNLPIILFGHSMGSFVAQRYIELYGDEIYGVILSGTDGRPDKITKLGILISKIEIMLRGRKAKSKLMDKLSFGNFNSNFKPNRTDYDWLCSVEEEVTRLRSHISQLREIIKSKEPTGKKMDFLIQEMNRETNTIGSKANNLEITNRVIDIKTILEDIREQIQNIE